MLFAIIGWVVFKIRLSTGLYNTAKFSFPTFISELWAQHHLFWAPHSYASHGKILMFFHSVMIAVHTAQSSLIFSFRHIDMNSSGVNDSILTGIPISLAAFQSANRYFQTKLAFNWCANISSETSMFFKPFTIFVTQSVLCSILWNVL